MSRGPQIALVGFLFFTLAHSFCTVVPYSNVTCSGYVNLPPGGNITVLATQVVGLQYIEIDFTSDVNITVYAMTRLEYDRYIDLPGFTFAFPIGDSRNFSSRIRTYTDMYIVLVDENKVGGNLTYSIGFSTYRSTYLTTVNAVIAIGICLGLLAFFQFVLRVCCCCHVHNRKAPYYRKSDDGKMQYQFKMPPPPLAKFALPTVIPITSIFFTKPMVPYMVYCINSNDLLWIKYPPITESLVYYARIYTTVLNLLFVFTFQSIWGLDLLESLSKLGRPLAWIISTIGIATIVSVLIAVFQAVLRPVIRVIAFNKKRMLFASSESEKKQKLGIALNYFIILVTLAMAGACVFEAFRTGLQVFVNNFTIFCFALVYRMYFPGLLFNFILFHVYSSFGSIPHGIMFWDEQYSMYYVQGTAEQDYSPTSASTSLSSSSFLPSAPSYNSTSTSTPPHSPAYPPGAYQPPAYATPTSPPSHTPYHTSHTPTTYPTSHTPTPYPTSPITYTSIPVPNPPVLTILAYIHQQKLDTPSQFYSPKDVKQPLLQQRPPSPHASLSHINPDNSNNSNGAILV
eukprot:Phypoly_transcript_05978.p1 GENE.Phypoly_transcript_05978~~Phypoly_transcript_05978.p1  ORF type:complete len:569 (-),score=86.13 Phypoly_transcript_05978:45-1751(-)